MAKPAFTTHTGMVDILPGEVEKWQYVEKIIRKTAKLFHFHEIRTPIMEQTELIARGVGQLTDIVSKEMFAFDRGDDHYVLRPEGTAPVARAFTEHHLEQRGGTQKLFYMGPMFRAERPQKGRQRQFHQFGAEILGSAHPLADAEIIAFMIYVYKEIGLHNFTLKLNSVGDPESRKKYKQVLQDYLRPNLSKLSKISQQRFETNPMRILDSKEEEDQPFIADAPVITDYLNEDCAEHYQQVKCYLDDLNIHYEEDPRLVRGLDYYTKTAFELVSPDLGSQDALGAGGRYDLLVEEIGGRKTPAVGFAAGIERLLIACEALNINLGTTPDVDVYIVTYGDNAREWALKHVEVIRNAGFSCTLDYAARSMKSQMKDADREGARFAIIVGEDELKSGKFTFRDMAQSAEASLNFDDILERLNDKLD
ncbi:MAG TPA: histidine--tRNA ligase [Balneolales bacterium]|nr:histidine--tRNA ligase [Balneolales bacterium]